MEVYKAILKRRSIRNFKNSRIAAGYLRSMVNAARMAPSAANIQPLEFLVVTNKSLCDNVFKCLRWAAYIAPKGNPKAGCEPAAYIIILVNKEKAAGPTYPLQEDLRGLGAAAENIMLFAQSKGIASCWLGAIDKAGIRNIFSMPKYLEVDSVIALGYPNMVSKPTEFNGSVKYYLNKDGILCVPKRPLKELLHINKI